MPNGGSFGKASHRSDEARWEVIETNAGRLPLPQPLPPGEGSKSLPPGGGGLVGVKQPGNPFPGKRAKRSRNRVSG